MQMQLPALIFYSTPAQKSNDQFSQSWKLLMHVMCLRWCCTRTTHCFWQKRYNCLIEKRLCKPQA